MGTVPFLRRAFTLIEMLVVVAIMMVLVAAAATRMRPASEARRIREAARALNVYLGSARNRAMETGRPCGVTLHRFIAGTPAAPLPTSAVMNLDQCEVPPPYAGGQLTSVATVTCTGNVASLQFFTDPTCTTPDWPTGSVRPGDLIQLNCQGPMYTVAPTSATINPVDSHGYVTGATLTVTFDTSQGQIVPWPTASPGTIVSYRIFRSPTMNKSAATPLQLPASTVVDLDASGIDGGAVPFNQFSAGGGDVAILFSPNGSVYGMYYVGGASTYVAQPIFLLVGKRERIPPPTYVATDPTTWANWQDPTNLWVVVNPQTGLVTSGEVAPVSVWNSSTSYAVGNAVFYSGVYYSCILANTNMAPATNPTYWTSTSGIAAARQLARDAQSMGGR